MNKKIIVLCCVLAAQLILVNFPRVFAEQPYAQIYPEQGDIYTNTYIQVRGLARAL